MQYLLFFIGLILGAAITWFWAAAKIAGLKEEKIKAETRLEEQDKATQKLSETFQVLAADALKRNNQDFLDLATQTLKTSLTEAQGDLGKRQEAIDGMVKPLKEALDKLQNNIKQDYGGLKTHLENLKELSDALKNPQARGRWGEFTLKRVVEMAGMSSHCDFSEQHSVATEEGSLRPDLLVKLPDNHLIVVDSKVPLESYMKAMQAENEETRKAELVQHAKTIRIYLQSLSSKKYWSQFPSAPDFVILFLPGESFFSAALEQDPELIDFGIKNRVMLATPTTLIPLLLVVAYSWQQYIAAENTELIKASAEELFDRVYRFAEHLGAIREGLNKAGKSFNDALASWITRILPSGRRLKELKAVGESKDFPDLKPIDIALRELPPIEENQDCEPRLVS